MDTSVLLGTKEVRLKTFVQAGGVLCVTAGVLLEIGDREDGIKASAIRKLRKFGFKCLLEPVDIIEEERKAFEKSLSLSSPLMSQEHTFKFDEAIDNLDTGKNMPDYERSRIKRIERKDSWWQHELIGKKIDYAIDEISHHDVEALAKAKFRKGVADSPQGVEDDRIRRAYKTYSSLSFDQIPPAFKGLLRFDALISLIRPLKKDQLKNAKIKLKHAEGVLKLKIDPNSLDDMRHFLASLPYVDCIMTCDFTMLRLLSFFHPQEQYKIKFLERN